MAYERVDHLQGDSEDGATVRLTDWRAAAWYLERRGAKRWGFKRPPPRPGVRHQSAPGPAPTLVGKLTSLVGSLAIGGSLVGKYLQLPSANWLLVASLAAMLLSSVFLAFRYLEGSAEKTSARVRSEDEFFSTRMFSAVRGACGPKA